MMYLHDQLKRGTYPNCNQVAQHFELDRRTIHRDIKFMEINFGLPIAYDGERKGYYYTSHVEQFPGVTLSEKELFAILVAQKAVANFQGTPFHKPLATAFKRLTEFLGDRLC
jgi:proteasome accessory factor B